MIFPPGRVISFRVLSACGETQYGVQLGFSVGLGVGELQSCGAGFLHSLKDSVGPVVPEEDVEGTSFPFELSSAPRCLVCCFIVLARDFSVLACVFGVLILGMWFGGVCVWF